MFTRQQLLSSAQALAHVSYMDAKGIASKEIRDAFRRAANDMVADLTGGKYTLHAIEIDPQFYHRDFPGEGNVELDFQVNIPAYRFVDGDGYMFAEVVVGYDHDGFTHCELCYY